MARRWTNRAKKSMIQGVGVYGIEWFRKNGGNAYDWPNALPGRSYFSCHSMARRLYGCGGLSRGSYSIRKLIEITGYGRSHLYRARKALGQKWKRLSSTGSYLIYEEQYLELVGWLLKDYWSSKHRLYNCIWCHGTEIPHRGKGLCLRCYRKYFKRMKRLGMPTENDLLLKYYLQHPEPCFDRKYPADVFDKIVKQLEIGRALPESFFDLPIKEDMCFTGF